MHITLQTALVCDKCQEWKWLEKESDILGVPISLIQEKYVGINCIEDIKMYPRMEDGWFYEDAFIEKNKPCIIPNQV